jgi:glycosyltransferase involved in cell wall biosynthesis
MSKKVAVIGTVGLPARYGGFETLTEYLSLHLGGQFDLTVFCSSKSYEKQIPTYNGVQLSYVQWNANGVQSIIYDIVSIIKSLRFADTLLILGVSGCIALPFVRLFTKKRIVTNIDGLEWKRNKWGSLAKRFLKFSERCAVNYSDAIVTDNQAIQEYVVKEYGKDSFLIEYGGDHITKGVLTNEVREQYSLPQKYAFKVCRIEPENNIQLILEGFRKSKELSLVLVGNWENSEYGRNLYQEYANEPNVLLLPPIYDQYILNQIRSNCSLYLHGHSAGGTNPSLVEAMSFGLPVLAYDVIYNRYTTENKALFFSDSEQLQGILEALDINALDDLGTEMAIIAEKRYIWTQISNKYAELF